MHLHIFRPRQLSSDKTPFAGMVRCETTLKSWGELQDIVRRSKERAENQGILGSLRRLKADQDEYDAFLKVVQEEWKCEY